MTEESRPEWKARLFVLNKVLMITMVMTIIKTMHVYLSDVKTHLKRRLGLVIGAVGQFGFLPLLGFGLAHALSLGNLEAIGTLLISTCSRCTLSNLVTSLSDGDVSLR